MYTGIRAEDGNLESHKPGTDIPVQKPSLIQRLRNRFPFLRTKKGIAVVVLVIVAIIGGGLAGLAALPSKGGGDNEPITDDVFFYGQSPPVYPSRRPLCLYLCLFTPQLFVW